MSQHILTPIITEPELETSELVAREAQPDPRKKHHKSPESYPNCGAPICKLRRALTAIKANKRTDTHDIQPSASEKWAMSPDIHGGAGYPHCGAPICVLRRALFGERAAEEQRTNPTAKQMGGGDEPAVCGFLCKVRRAVVG
ncbi:MAG: hypothetical protein LQ350_008589 [Teloschistes chrysophthalmus]|nr:MAG: hypothetical protein LQ350_008589 [Niorma chrysophthalma]